MSPNRSTLRSIHGCWLAYSVAGRFLNSSSRFQSLVLKHEVAPLESGFQGRSFPPAVVNSVGTAAHHENQISTRACFHANEVIFSPVNSQREGKSLLGTERCLGMLTEMIVWSKLQRVTGQPRRSATLALWDAPMACFGGESVRQTVSCYTHTHTQSNTRTAIESIGWRVVAAMQWTREFISWQQLLLATVRPNGRTGERINGVGQTARTPTTSTGTATFTTASTTPPLRLSGPASVYCEQRLAVSRIPYRSCHVRTYVRRPRIR